MTQSAQAAKMIKAELKKVFPNIDFSVTSSRFAGGDSVSIDYKNGIPASEVKKITNKYQRGHFDGMQDLYEYTNARDDIPQAKYVSVSRDIDKEIMG